MFTFNLCIKFKLIFQKYLSFWKINAYFDFLEFSPFEIAATTVICVSKELEINGIDEVFTRFVVDKVR